MIETSGGYEPPEEVEFRSGQETVTLQVLTDDDDVAESTSRVTARLQPGDEYRLGSDFDPERPGDGPGQRSLGPATASPSSSTATSSAAATATATATAASSAASSSGCDCAHGTVEPAGRRWGR